MSKEIGNVSNLSSVTLMISEHNSQMIVDVSSKLMVSSEKSCVRQETTLESLQLVLTKVEKKF
jgi:hypothetical protein